MWICLNDSFLSIVAHKDVKHSLLVRARAKGDIEALFSSAKVETTPSADYPYRAIIKRREGSAALSARVEGIGYFNFKDSVKNRARHEAYLHVYDTLRRALPKLSE